MGEREVTPVDLFAFWAYDLFPYLLGARVTKLDEEGLAYAPSFQDWFRPVYLLTPRKGERIKRELEQLREEHRAARGRRGLPEEGGRGHEDAEEEREVKDERMKHVHVFRGTVDGWTETLCGIPRSETDPIGSYEEALGRATRAECWDLTSVDVYLRTIRDVPELKARFCDACVRAVPKVEGEEVLDRALERIGGGVLSVFGSPMIGLPVEAKPERARVAGAVVVGALRAVTPELAGLPLSGPTLELQRRANEVLDAFVRESLR